MGLAFDIPTNLRTAKIVKRVGTITVTPRYLSKHVPILIELDSNAGFNQRNTDFKICVQVFQPNSQDNSVETIRRTSKHSSVYTGEDVGQLNPDLFLPDLDTDSLKMCVYNFFQ